jgi:hypothetical protein
MSDLTDGYLNLWLTAANLNIDMTRPTRKHHDRTSDLLRLAAERSEALATSTHEERRSVEWHYEAAHVGDMSVAALALLRR